VSLAAARRYIIRQQRYDGHLKSGAVAAFAIVRGVGGSELLAVTGAEGDVTTVALNAAAYLGESFLVFAFAAAALEVRPHHPCRGRSCSTPQPVRSLCTRGPVGKWEMVVCAGLDAAIGWRVCCTVMSSSIHVAMQPGAHVYSASGDAVSDCRLQPQVPPVPQVTRVCVCCRWPYSRVLSRPT
jgi:hypothetical protein